MTTLLQEFNLNGLVAWWDEKYATQDFNNRNEKGRDFGRFPVGTPIASISSGRVVYAQQMNSDPGSSVGYIVQVENADGSLFHYQHLRSTSLRVGDYVHAGDIVGLSGGCPASGYGTKGCTHTDQYTTGPHIEVRYAPHYDPSRGAWGQQWQNPEAAFNAYGSQSLAGNMLGSLGLAGNAANAVQGAGLGGIDWAGAIASGIANGLRGAGSSFVAPAEDFTIRGSLMFFGALLAGIGLFLLGQDAPPVRGAKEVGRETVGKAIGAEVGSQTAQAVVPAFGSKKRIREEAQARPAQQQIASPAPRQIASPEQKALPAPSEPEVYKMDEVAAANRAKRAKQYEGIEATAREIQPPNLPLPKDAEAGAQRRQVENRAKRDDREAQRRIDRNMRRRRRA